jgi:hypothetical protein
MARLPLRAQLIVQREDLVEAARRRRFTSALL